MCCHQPMFGFGTFCGTPKFVSTANNNRNGCCRVCGVNVQFMTCGNKRERKCDRDCGCDRERGRNCR